MKITRRDLLEYIEERLLNEEHEDWEYEFYSQYKWDGMKVFKDKIYIYKLKLLANQLREELDWEKD